MQLVGYEYTGNRKQLMRELPQPKIELQGHFKTDTSLDRPTFIISKRNEVNFNYLKIAYGGFDYYYFIDDIIMQNDCQLLVCTIDVLYTFQADILKNNVIISRCANPNYWNAKTDNNSEGGSIVDGLVVTGSKNKHIIKDATDEIYTADALSTYFYLTTTN